MASLARASRREGVSAARTTTARDMPDGVSGRSIEDISLQSAEELRWAQDELVTERDKIGQLRALRRRLAAQTVRERRALDASVSATSEATRRSKWLADQVSTATQARDALQSDLRKKEGDQAALEADLAHAQQVFDDEKRMLESLAQLFKQYRAELQKMQERREAMSSDLRATMVARDVKREKVASLAERGEQARQALWTVLDA